MEESVVLNEEAGKENEQMLAILSRAEEASSKDKIEMNFCKRRNSKTLNTRLRAT